MSDKCPVCHERMMHEQDRAGFLCRKCCRFYNYLQLINMRSENAGKAGAVSVAETEAGGLSLDR